MNEKNVEYLKNLLEHLGFGNRLNYVLETAIRQDFPLFSLGVEDLRRPPGTKHLTAAPKDLIRYELNFNKSKTTDTRFLNDMKVVLYPAGQSVPRTHTFDLERDHRITALQAYKLLSGQSFEKEVLLKPTAEQLSQNADAQAIKQRTWFKLNLDITDAYGHHPLRKFAPEYGFDPENPLSRYLIEGLDNPAIKEQVVKDLRNGNLLSGQLRLFDMVVPVYFAANPQFRSIDIYDQQMNRIPDQQIFSPEQIEQHKQQQAKLTDINPVVAAGLENQLPVQLPWEPDPGQEIQGHDAARIRR